MKLFKQKKTIKQQPDESVDEVFDAKFRQELRQMGRAHFQKILDEQTADLKSDVDDVLEQLTGSLRRHMASQLDLAITRINNDISSQFKEQMNEYNRVSSEAQELVVQSLSRNAQSVHEKYQQMSTNLQQVIANQEVMMVGVFQDNQSRVASLQSEQDRVFDELRHDIEAARVRHRELGEKLTSSVEDQSHRLEEMYAKNTDRANEIGRAQDQSIETLSRSVRALEEQYSRLEQLLDDSIARQKARAKELVNDNLSRIVEHYLVTALGEGSDLVRDLPKIMEKLEESKQAMMDDISL